VGATGAAGFAAGSPGPCRLRGGSPGFGQPQFEFEIEFEFEFEFEFEEFKNPSGPFHCGDVVGCFGRSRDLRVLRAPPSSPWQAFEKVALPRR